MKKFDLERIEKNLNNAQNNYNDIKLSDTYIYDKNSIIELYILFIMFSIFPMKNIKLTEYDVD
tara:strand:- start:368 stop:556 length:189 start_codon:yes stop_codon:yes gene_type:complete